MFVYSKQMNQNAVIDLYDLKTYLYMRANCQNPVRPKKKLTANKFQFFGIMTIE